MGQIGYKDVDRPKNALPLGEMLGHSVLNAVQTITTSSSCELSVLQDTLFLPRVDASVSVSSSQHRRDFDDIHAACRFHCTFLIHVVCSIGSDCSAGGRADEVG